MACPAILTGNDFLVRVLGHIDCQAQALGSFGWQALAEPGSTASFVITGLLTLFIALFGVRLLFGPAPTGRDIVWDVAKIGLVLTLALSWPAVRVLLYDVVLSGPPDIASSVSSPITSGDAAPFARQLQDADDAMVRLTELGSGRNIGEFVDPDAPGGTFAGTAIENGQAFGYGRLVYLASVIGALALLRLIAGILLALAPLASGLLLFDATRGLFAGWLRGLVLALLGSTGITIVLAAQLAILRPWLDDALRLRVAGYATPSAPIELFALTLAFAIAQFAIIWILAKVAFYRGWVTVPLMPELRLPEARTTSVAQTNLTQSIETNRATRIAQSVENQMRREEFSIMSQRNDYRTLTKRGEGPITPSANNPTREIRTSDRLGTQGRRTSSRTSLAATRRDRTT